MAQIAHVRSFDGVDDTITLASTGFVTAPGPTTIAAILKSNDLAATGDVWALSGGTGSEWSMEILSNEGLALYDEVGGFTFAPVTLVTTETWMLLAATKADGSAAPRFHFYNYDTLSWTHEDGADVLADQGTPAGSPVHSLGSFGASAYFGGEIACVGVWVTTALSDGQLESMTDAIADWEALAPTGLWLLNQDTEAVAVLDRIGSADQTAIVGTTAVVEAGLAFDVDAFVAPTVNYVTRSNQRW